MEREAESAYMVLPSKWEKDRTTDRQCKHIYNLYCSGILIPWGAHPSNNIGEIPVGGEILFQPLRKRPSVKLSQMKVLLMITPQERDGCIRDYIHVSDIAHAHTLALNYLLEHRNSSNCDVFNLKR